MSSSDIVWYGMVWRGTYVQVYILCMCVGALRSYYAIMDSRYLDRERERKKKKGIQRKVNSINKPTYLWTRLCRCMQFYEEISERYAFKMYMFGSNLGGWSWNIRHYSPPMVNHQCTYLAGGFKPSGKNVDRPTIHTYYKTTNQLLLLVIPPYLSTITHA